MSDEPRHWLVAEIVQTSSMDCGPATLSALLRGHGIAADYGRLREACQTGVDGTSIDVLEGVLNQLGLAAEQVMLPPDRLFSGLTPSLPAIAVTRLADGAPHFIVVWRRIGAWVQVMDPADGRRWLHRDRLLPRLLRHKMSVPAADWLDWARGPEGLPPLQARLRALGMSDGQVTEALSAALSAPLWFPLAAAEAALRLVEALVVNRAIRPGAAAVRLWQALYDQTCGDEGDIHALLPQEFWSVAPDPDSARLGQRHLILDGAVLLRVTGRRDLAAVLPPDLAAAMAPSGPGIWARLSGLLRQDGLVAPLILLAALALALPATLLEAGLLRLLAGSVPGLAVPEARFGFLLGVLGLMAALLALRLPLGAEGMRLGRRLDLRLRMALLAKLPRLNDRFQSSRPVSDMADRAQSLHLLRQAPGMALHVVQAVASLALTAGGLIWLAPASLPWVVAVAMAAVLLPFLAAGRLAEGEMALRSKGAALSGVWFDALRGQAAIRAHHAGGAMRHQHEALLTGWLAAARQLTDRAALLALLRQAVVLALLVALILSHAQRLDLLFLWWAFKLPDLGQDLAGLIRLMPAQRAILARLFEPLSAPETAPGLRVRRAGPVGVQITGGQVVAGGHVVLSDLNLTIRPGEHVAVVGLSGSGKSSLLGLLLGWHRLAQGELRVDGVPLEEGDLPGLRARTAWVDPAVQVWNDSLLHNIGFATPGATAQEVARAVSGAGLSRLMDRRPGGMLGAAGDGGGLLSGGEGQRLRFARALAQRDVGLALLDEPFRGLDRATRSALLQTARRQWRGATLLWVTHDLAEIAGFDRVLVVEGGRIVQDGRPADLAETPGRFADLVTADANGPWGPEAWTRLWLEDGDVRHRD